MKKVFMVVFMALSAVVVNANGWFKNLPKIGIGIGTTQVYDNSRLGLTLEGICYGAMVSYTYTSTTTGSKYSNHDCIQVGYMIPVKDFSKGENKIRALLVSPIVEFGSKTNYKLSHKHKDTAGHICQWVINENYKTDGYTSFGAAVMYRHDIFTAMIKVTAKSAGLTVGFAI